MTTPNTPSLTVVETETTRIDGKLGQIITLMTAVADTSQSGGPAAPTGLQGFISSARKVTLNWNAIPDPDVVWDVHELLTDPANTFKATVTTPTIAFAAVPVGGYRYAVLARNGAGRSPLSLSLGATVTSSGGSTSAGG